MMQHHRFSALGARLDRSNTRAERDAAVKAHMSRGTHHTIPAMAQKCGKERMALFIEQAKAVGADVTPAGNEQELVGAIYDYILRNNLPVAIRMGHDPRFKGLMFDKAGADARLERFLVKSNRFNGQKEQQSKDSEPFIDSIKSEKALSYGPSNGEDKVTLSYATCGIAETGSVMLVSGPDNPASLTFLGTYHLVILDKNDIVANVETAFKRIALNDKGEQSARHVALVSGPSRSADIEQTLLMGAHGPKHLAIFIRGT